MALLVFSAMFLFFCFIDKFFLLTRPRIVGAMPTTTMPRALFMKFSQRTILGTVPVGTEGQRQRFGSGSKLDPYHDFHDVVSPFMFVAYNFCRLFMLVTYSHMTFVAL